MRSAGLEPARSSEHRVLSAACLPVPTRSAQSIQIWYGREDCTRCISMYLARRAAFGCAHRLSFRCVEPEDGGTPIIARRQRRQFHLVGKLQRCGRWGSNTGHRWASTLGTPRSAGLNYIRERNRMRVRSTHSEERTTCIETWSEDGNRTRSHEFGRLTLCLLSDFPQNSERMRPSRFHVLRRFLTSSGLSPSRSQTHHRVLNASACCATGEASARCDARVRALDHS